MCAPSPRDQRCWGGARETTMTDRLLGDDSTRPAYLTRELFPARSQRATSHNTPLHTWQSHRPRIRVGLNGSVRWAAPSEAIWKSRHGQASAYLNADQNTLQSPLVYMGSSACF